MPDDLAPTRVVIGSVRVISQRFRSSDGRAWTPVAGAVRFRDVDRVPVSFASEEAHDGQRWFDLGVCVSLEVGR